jgi:HEAT repeat protein
MRHGLMILALAFFVAAADSQDKKKDKDTGKDPKTPEMKEPADFLGKTFDQLKAVLQFGPKKAGEAMKDILDELMKHKKSPVDLSVRINGITAVNTYFARAQEPSERDIKSAIDVYRMFMTDPQVILKMRAVQGAQYLRYAGHELIPDVIKVAQDGATWELRKEAVQSLIAMAPDKKGVPDPSILPALKRAAIIPPKKNSESAYVVRMLAVQGLGMHFKEAAILDLRNALEDPAKDVRVMAVQGLALCKEKALVDLRNAIKDQPNKEVQLMAIQAIGVAGKDKALPDLRKLLDHSSKEFRLQAVQTIARLKGDIPDNDKITLKTLNEHSGSEKDPIVKMWLHAVIMSITDINKKHMDPIIKNIHHDDKSVRAQALQIAGMSGEKGKAFVVPPVFEVIDKCRGDDLDLAMLGVQVLVSVHSFESESRLKAIMADPKTPSELKETIEDAIEGFEILRQQINKKKDAEKK